MVRNEGEASGEYSGRGQQLLIFHELPPVQPIVCGALSAHMPAYQTPVTEPRLQACTQSEALGAPCRKGL